MGLRYERSNTVRSADIGSTQSDYQQESTDATARKRSTITRNEQQSRQQQRRQQPLQHIHQQQKLCKQSSNLVVDELKVVIRKLPPSMTKQSFLEQVAPLAAHDYFNFLPADYSYGVRNAVATAHIHFLSFIDMLTFKEKFDNYTFLDSRGNEYVALVELAPYPRIPCSSDVTTTSFGKNDGDVSEDKGRRDDVLSELTNTIEDDDMFRAFVEELSIKPVTENKMDFDIKLNESKETVLTPLLEFVNKRRANQDSCEFVRGGKRSFDRRSKNSRGNRNSAKGFAIGAAGSNNSGGVGGRSTMHLSSKALKKLAKREKLLQKTENDRLRNEVTQKERKLKRSRSQPLSQDDDFRIAESANEQEFIEKYGEILIQEDVERKTDKDTDNIVDDEDHDGGCDADAAKDLKSVISRDSGSSPNDRRCDETEIEFVETVEYETEMDDDDDDDEDEDDEDDDDDDEDDGGYGDNNGVNLKDKNAFDYNDNDDNIMDELIDDGDVDDNTDRKARTNVNKKCLSVDVDDDVDDDDDEDVVDDDDDEYDEEEKDDEQRGQEKKYEKCEVGEKTLSSLNTGSCGAGAVVGGSNSGLNAIAKNKKKDGKKFDRNWPINLPFLMKRTESSDGVNRDIGKKVQIDKLEVTDEAMDVGSASSDERATLLHGKPTKDQVEDKITSRKTIYHMSYKEPLVKIKNQDYEFTQRFYIHYHYFNNYYNNFKVAYHNRKTQLFDHLVNNYGKSNNKSTPHHNITSSAMTSNDPSMHQYRSSCTRSASLMLPSAASTSNTLGGKNIGLHRHSDSSSSKLHALLQEVQMNNQHYANIFEGKH